MCSGRVHPYERYSAVSTLNHRSNEREPRPDISIRQSAPPSDYLMDILRFRLGFVLPLISRKDYAIRGVGGWKRVVTTLSSSQRLDEDYFGPIIIGFIETLSERNESKWTAKHKWFLTDVWDLMEDNYMTLRTDMNRTKAQYLIPLPKALNQQDFRGSDHQYMILANKDVHLAFIRPLYVVHALRWGNIPVKDIASRFLKHGVVPFRTFIKLDYGWKAWKETDPAGINYQPAKVKLPYRKHGYKFTVEDYEEAEKRRAKILSQPHARAAWLYDGPSKTATVYGHRYYVDCGSDYNKQKFCDDILSLVELDVISGAFQVERFEREPGNGGPMDPMSWWPTHKVWTKSTGNLGWWTEDDEKWFHEHLCAIRSGKFQPKSPYKWGEILRARAIPQQRRLVEVVDRKALEVLRGLGAPPHPS